MSDETPKLRPLPARPRFGADGRLVERARVAVEDLDGSDRFDDIQLLRFVERARGVDPGSVLAVVEIELRRRAKDRWTAESG